MTDLPALDPLKVAAQVGHGAAVNVLLAFDHDAEQASWWVSGGVIRPGRDPFEVADRLAATFCRGTDADPPGGERVWREAAELRLHQLPAAGFETQTTPVRLAFRMFGLVAHATWRELTARAEREKAAAAAAARPRKPVKLADTIYETLDETGARDPHRVKALKRIPQGRSGTARKAPSTGSGTPGGDARDVGVQPAAPLPSHKSAVSGKRGGMADAVGAKLSIGERPIDMAKQVKPKHGGKREKKQ